MIPPEKRAAIYNLHKEGMSIRELSRRLNVDRKTIKRIIAEQGVMPTCSRKGKGELDPELLRDLHKKCNGYVKRIHEILSEEKAIPVAYSTVSEKIRELGLGAVTKNRCSRVPDEPGAEMQHDTSEYSVEIGGKKTKVIGSLIYFRYSKIRYLKFYRSFNRFRMKCFFHEALSYWGYAASTCIIDNTNLARLRGSGKNAVMVSEMEQFALQYGFVYVCHEIDHCNRKAGNERSFYTVETNFFPGRRFENMADLNTQALHWATVRFPSRPVSKTKLLPLKAFEYEQSFLKKLPPYLPQPYLTHQRCTDQYGYISFDGNYYWIPGTKREDVVVLNYDSYIKIFQKRTLLIQYPLPDDYVKNQCFEPPEHSSMQHRQPSNRKQISSEEEKKLRTISPEVDEYLNFAIEITDKKRHRFICQLYHLSQKLAPQLFIKTLQRALRYRIKNIETIERIAVLQMKKNNYSVPFADYDQHFENRDAYKDGCFSDDIDLSDYDCGTGDENG
jgi:transposase